VSCGLYLYSIKCVRRLPSFIEVLLLNLGLGFRNLCCCEALLGTDFVRGIRRYQHGLSIAVE